MKTFQEHCGQVTVQYRTFNNTHACLLKQQRTPICNGHKDPTCCLTRSTGLHDAYYLWQCRACQGWNGWHGRDGASPAP